MNPFCTAESAIAWAEEQPFTRDMAACVQDASYHAEGDVFSHTKMVIRELPKVPGWSDFSADEKQLLIPAALFHDCGKPKTTQVEDGQITSRGHSRAGARLARNILRDLGLGLVKREAIVNLILCHGWPPRFIEQRIPEMEVIKAAWLCQNDMLWTLATADAKGRQGKDSGFLDALGLWKAMAQELDCWRQPFPSANREAKLLAFEDRDKDIRFYNPQEPARGCMTLMSGPPGAGKDTWLHAHCPNLPVVSLDILRETLDIDPTDSQGPVIAAAKEMAREHLRAGTSFAFNATNVVRDTRARWIRLARDYSFQVKIVYLEPPLPRLLAQNKKRPAPVPESVILSLLEKLDVPLVSEAHEILLIP